MDGLSGNPLTSSNIQYVLAFIIVVLSGVIVYQNRRIVQLGDKIDAIQLARITDAKETNDKVTAPLWSISQTVNLLYDKLRESKEHQS